MSGIIYGFYITSPNFYTWKKNKKNIDPLKRFPIQKTLITSEVIEHEKGTHGGI